MSEESLVKYCSPTLAGLKTANMFTFRYEDRESMHESLRSWNKRLSGKGLRVIPLRFRGNVALLYVFRPSHLNRDLQNKQTSQKLKELGYSSGEMHKCIHKLINRIGESQEFPHEIGFFLGYPPEDVCGFIDNKAENFKHAGMWKVYGDVNTAQNLFQKYKKCTSVYSNKWKNGSSIERLSVSI